MKVQYDYINSVYNVGFILDRQFPATPYGVYMMDAVLNGQPIAGSPFAVRVDPGPVYGPLCEVTGLTATNTSVLNGNVNELFQLEVVARDKFGNRQAYSDSPDNWVVQMLVAKGSGSGSSTIIKVSPVPALSTSHIPINELSTDVLTCRILCEGLYSECTSRDRGNRVCILDRCLWQRPKGVDRRQLHHQPHHSLLKRSPLWLWTWA